MGSKRAKKRSNPTTEVSPPHAPTLQTLISAIQPSQVLSPPFLKSLYLSLNESIRSSDNEIGFKLKSQDISSAANILFNELDRRFKVLFSALFDDSANRADEGSVLGLDMPASVDELTLLLRCCLVILTLFDPDALLLEKTQFLLFRLGKLFSLVISGGGNEENPFTFEKFVSRESSYGDADSTTPVSEDFVASLSILESSDPRRPLLCAVLEVFADELLLRRLLRGYFMHVASGTSVLEVISVHFILSLSDEQAFENFPNRLSCRGGKGFRVPELSPITGVSLLNLIVLSAPKLFQAHFILLVSEAIGIYMSSEYIRPNLDLMTCYLTAFEWSVIMYTEHMSTLLKNGHPVGSKGSYANPCLFDRTFQPSFECHIQDTTRAKIYDLGVKSDSLWNSRLCNMFYKEKSDLLAESIAYINDSHQVFDESCKDDILSISSSIIIGSFSDSLGDTVLYKKGETSPQDIYLLAAILKLMSSSLSTVIWCLRHDANLGCLKTLEDASLCREYDFIVDVVGCFQHFNIYLPNQKIIFNMMETHMTRHKMTKWILMHFQGLLSFSFASGIDFLVKNCVSVIVTLMNLYVFEEGSLGALRSLLVPGAESISSEACKVGEALGDQKLSEKIASKIQKIKAVYLSTESSSYFPLRSEDEMVETSQNVSILKHRKESTVGIEEEIEESCNGKVFLNCVNISDTHDDYDDLADFIECKQGKNYSRWLKNWERYRQWKSQKRAVLRWKRKKDTWKSMARGKVKLSCS